MIHFNRTTMVNRFTMALVAIAALGGLTIAQPGWAADRTAIRTMITAEARAMDFPASLALAVAQSESAFDADAESHKGARGLMQIMPATAIGEYGLHPDVLWDPRSTVALAAATGAAFVREIFTGTYASDMGPWTPDAGAAMRYRNRLGRRDLAMFYNVSAEFADSLERA